MPKYIIKIKDKYLEWSTVVDAPVTYGLSLEEFTKYYAEEYGQQGMRGLPDRLKRVESKGTSSMLDDSIESLISGNTLASDGAKLTLDEIYQVYCLRLPL